MPCNTVQYTSIDASKMQTPLLVRALERLGYQVHQHVAGRVIQFSRDSELGSYSDGHLRVPGGFDGARLTRAYSRELVKAEAARAGFAVRGIDETHLEMYKRA